MKIGFIVCVILFAAHWLLLPQSLSTQYFVKPVELVGKVYGIPKYNRLGERFFVKVKTINGKKIRGNVQLSWYQHAKTVVPGERWRWLVKLKPVHGLRNPGGFNTARWAKMRGIIASAYVISKSKSLCLSKSFGIDRYRFAIENLFRSKEGGVAGVINALTIGSKNLLSPEAWSIFQRTGTSHLVAISGLHVGLVIAMSFFIFNCIFRCFPWVLLRCPSQRLALFSSTIVAWCYAFLVGFSLPTQRAVIMVTVFMLSYLFCYPASVWKKLLLSFCFVVAWQPLSIYSSSLWLSFIAVFWLAYAKMIRWPVHLLLALGLLPITLFFFYQFSVISLLANMVAIPWVSFVIVPLCFFATMFLFFSKTVAYFFWIFAIKCVAPLWMFLKWLSDFSWGVWLHPINDVFILLLSMFSILLLAAPRGFPCRLLGLILLLPLLFYFPERPKTNAFWLTVLDVGEGLSSVVQTSHHVLVYDTGPRYVTGFDAGRSVVVPFLQRSGIHKINAMVISHGDNDHIGGSYWISRHYAVDAIYSSLDRSRWPQRFFRCRAGQHWRWDGVSFNVLWPEPGQVYAGNNSSCVLRVSNQNHSVLLTGDIEWQAEQALSSKSALLKSEVLVAPHHGSRTSSSLAFVRAVQPKQVVISSGFHNRYHFPAKSVLDRYHQAGVQTLSTALRGAVFVSLGIVGGIRDNERLN